MFPDDKNKTPPKQGYHAATQRFASTIHHTVILIGGQDDYKLYKKVMALKEEEDAKRSAQLALEARNRAVEIVEKHVSRVKADDESFYIDQIKALNAFVKANYYDGKGHYRYTLPLTEFQTKDKKSLWTRLKEFFDGKA